MPMKSAPRALLSIPKTLIFAALLPSMACTAPQRRPIYEPTFPTTRDSAKDPETSGESRGPSLIVGLGSSDNRYPPHGKITGLREPKEGLTLTAWRGERVSAIVVAHANLPQSNLRVECSGLRSTEALIPVKGRFIRYTMAKGEPQADIIDHADHLELSSDANRPIWIEIDVPASIPPGLYQGVFKVKTDGDGVDIPLKLEVLAPALLPPAEWRFHLDLWQHPEAVARFHDVPAWSDAHFALLKPAMLRLAQAGQKTITTSLVHEAWGGQTYDAFPSMIIWKKHADGNWTYDYSVFDRWVKFASEECGLAHARIHGYTMIPWSMRFRYLDDASNAWKEEKLEPGTEAYDAYWGAFLKDFRNHLKDMGWLNRMSIGIDERPDHLMRAAWQTLRKHAPEIQVASAVNRPTGLTREFGEISLAISHASSLTAEQLAARRAAGMVSTFYVCNQPSVPNTYTHSLPAEAEWLPIFAIANGFDGFLRWAYHSWPENPMVATDFQLGPPGDSFLVYPGDRSSIRFERLREGIETCEKIRLVRELRSHHPSQEFIAALDEVEKCLQTFQWETGKEAGTHGIALRRLNESLLKASRLAWSPGS